MEVLMTAEDIANKCQISLTVAERLMKSGEIPCYDVTLHGTGKRRKLRARPVDVERWLMQREVQQEAPKAKKKVERPNPNWMQEYMEIDPRTGQWRCKRKRSS